MADLSIPDLNWLAGLWEGEGSFGFAKTYAFAYLAMTDRDVVQRAAGLIGAKVYPRPATRPGWKPQYAIVLGARRALVLMHLLQPLLGARRQEQIRCAIERSAARPGTGAHERAKTACPRGHAYTIVTAQGWRQCRVCQRDNRRRRYQRTRLIAVRPVENLHG